MSTNATPADQLSMNRQEWLAARRGGIGASESAALFGLHPYISPMSLYVSKITDVDMDETGNERQEDGKIIEPRIAARYAKATGRAVIEPEKRLYSNPKYPHMICSPDRFAILDDGSRIPAELKWWDNFREGDEVPEYGQIQLQHQQAVLDAAKGALAILGSFRSFHHFDIPRHQPFIDLLAEKVREFWKLVESRTPPPADGSEATAKALKTLYPKDKGTTIFLPPEASVWAVEWESAKAEVKAAEERMNAVKLALIAAIGDNTFGTLPSGQQLSLKTQDRDGYTVAPTSFRVLRTVKEKKGKE